MQEPGKLRAAAVSLPGVSQLGRRDASVRSSGTFTELEKGARHSLLRAELELLLPEQALSTIRLVSTPLANSQVG